MRVSERIDTIKVEIILSLAPGDQSVVFWSIPLVNRMELATRSTDPVVWQCVSKPGPEIDFALHEKAAENQVSSFSE